MEVRRVQRSKPSLSEFVNIRTMVCIGWILVAIISLPLQAQVEDANALLTVARIFDSNDFKAESVKQLQWLEQKGGYTWVRENEDSNDAQDIVYYNPETDSTDVLVAARQLIPQGLSSPLTIDGYQWSKDMKKVLIFTNTQQVWRRHTRGDYWVLNRDTHDLAQLGGRAEPSQLMFAKFSPDGTRVAYVYQRNIYVEDLVSHGIRKLTHTPSDHMINGTSDWVYEEELGLRDGFRWSPDGTAIAYWQFDVSDVNEFVLVNYTDDLYPRLKRFAYPKAGQTNAACRVGVVRASGGPTCWIKVPGDPRNHYIHAMEWLEDSHDLIIQQLNRLQNTHSIVAGVIIIVMGLHFLGVFRIGLLYREARMVGPVASHHAEHNVYGHGRSLGGSRYEAGMDRPRASVSLAQRTGRMESCL